MSDNIENSNSRKNAIIGALVADAASLGFHWLYDQPRIRGLAPDSPEFRQPAQADFDGVPGFFAHPNKFAGELSHYGEQALVMLTSLSVNDGKYDKSVYEKCFQEQFGYGGDFRGYIDRPTRNTLDNIARAEYNAVQRAKSTPYDGNDTEKNTLITKVLVQVRNNRGTDPSDAVRKAVKITHDNESSIAFALQILAEFDFVNAYHGADDVQLPAISKLPALVAASSSDGELRAQTECAVRVTNNNDQAVEYGHAAARMIAAAISGATPQQAIASSLESAAPDTQTLFNEAISLTSIDNPAATAKFGLSCQLNFGVPSTVHNITTAPTFVDAVRNNIYAAGDNCGRAILLGAVLGACYGTGGEKGIPESWTKKLDKYEYIQDKLQMLAKT